MSRKQLQREIARALSDAEVGREVPAMLKREFVENDARLPAVILYEKTPNNGHWAMLHNSVNEDGEPVIEFFDSYGMKPDQANKVMRLDDRPEILKYLLRHHDDGKLIVYNHFPFQKIGEGINTCGRHCMVRHRYADMSIEEYHRRLKRAAKKTGLDFDEIVTILT